MEVHYKNKGPMDKDNGVGQAELIVGDGRWAEQGRAMGEKWGQM